MSVRFGIIRERSRKAPKLAVFDEEKISERLLTDAKTIGIPAGMAIAITEKIVEAVKKWVGSRPALTVDDLNRKLAEEAEKYSTDLAYVYKNRGKII